MELTATLIIAFFQCAAAHIEAQRDLLIQLDSPIGDADHGSNLDRGFGAIVARLESSAEPDIGALLRVAGTTLVSTVGGSSGPLYGTFFLRAGAALAGRTSASLADLADGLAAGVEGIMARGKAQPGEKTMVDTLAPAVAELRAALADGADPPSAMRRAVAAAEAGMRATIPMLATKGRASYLGERSIGHQDPGATSAYYLMLALNDVISQRPSHRA
jgi:phosphoenolpyruvate---glycerone phosphotransferase subunit DhaL